MARVCDRARSVYRGRVLCPPDLPPGGFAPPRLFVAEPCQYMIDLEPAAERAGRPVFHMLLGGRCGELDLSARADGTWPRRAALPNDLRLVGKLPLEPGGPTTPRPARPTIIRRSAVRGHPALLVRYPAHPLTTVHSGHLALVWNEGEAGFVVSGHPAGARGDVVAALRMTAAGLR